MSKIKFKKALIKVIEEIVKMDLPDTSIRLVSHYFNESKATSIKMRALDAIDRYIENNQFQFFKVEMGNKVRNSIEKMLIEAQLWEAEINEQLEILKQRDEKRKKREELNKTKKKGKSKESLNVTKI